MASRASPSSTSTSGWTERRGIPVVPTATVAILFASAVGGAIEPARSAPAAATFDPLAVAIGSPQGIAVGPKGEIYIASPETGRVFEVGRDRSLRIVALDASVRAPTGLAVDPAGNLYVSDPQAGCVYRIAGSTRALSIMAGSGTVQGDEGPAPAARLVRPTGLAWTRKGELLIADPGDHRVRLVDRDGRIHTLAGDGVPGDYGDGGPVLRARLSRPEAVAADARGNIYIADRGNNRVRRVANKTTTISTVVVAGGLGSPNGLTVDQAGNLWIADEANHRLVKLDRQGVTVGGWSDPVASPGAIAWDSGQGLLFADGSRRLVLRVFHGRAELVAGNGAPSGPGDPRPSP